MTEQVVNIPASEPTQPETTQPTAQQPVVLTDENTLTWADLSTAQVKTVYVEKYGKYMQYKRFVPLDMLASWQTQYLRAGNRDVAGYTIAILRYAMISPALTTPDAVRAAQKADGALLLQIMGDVANESAATEVVSAAKN